MNNAIKILCTRPLNESLRQEIREAGMHLTEESFIVTEPIQAIDVQQEIETALLQSTAVVFTSMNAVEAVALYHDGTAPDWEIFCVGNTTTRLARRYFGDQQIAGSADDAASLADLIIENGEVEEVTFFCGDMRRDELPAMLQEHGIAVNEITVYQTIAVPHKLSDTYQGILFFSPSAVESFFRNNKVVASTVLFAIGKTTAKELRKYSANTIITSDEPGKENLVRTMIDFFS